jgi:hypothetical protein
MSNDPKYLVEFALQTVVKFLELEGIDITELVDKYSGKVLGNELGFDGGLRPMDKLRALELIKSVNN